jgi:hypothetical protein
MVAAGSAVASTGGVFVAASIKAGAFVDWLPAPPEQAAKDTSKSMENIFQTALEIAR